MKKGNLILIPNLIGENSITESIPLNIHKEITNTNFYIVENIRSARRFIKKICPKKIIEEITFFAYGKHDNIDLEKDFLQNILSGNDIGLISEAGVPAVADPGSKIVEYAHNYNIKVRPLVGPSSILLSLMASGMNGQNFSFSGYLPIEKKARVNKIKELEKIAIRKEQTQIFMETPYRNNKLFETLIKTCNSNTRLCIASNITTEKESILTKDIIEWRNTKVDINKQPTIFLIS